MAFAKAIFSALFDFVISRINVTLKGAAGLDAPFIGLLDVFGFERSRSTPSSSFASISRMRSSSSSSCAVSSRKRSASTVTKRSRWCSTTLRTRAALH